MWWVCRGGCLNSAMGSLGGLQRGGGYLADTSRKSFPCGQEEKGRTSCRGAVEINLTRNHQVAGSIPGLTQWVKDLVLP